MLDKFGVSRIEERMADTSATSQKKHCRVLIVGAGPGGTATAVALARAGVDGVTLVDAHDFPRDKTCGSGLSGRAIDVLKDLGIWSRIEPMAYPITGVRIVTPRGYDKDLSAGNDVQAVICLRRHLDHEMLKAGLERGVEFVSQFRAREPILERGRWVGLRTADHREIRADYVVVANGAHSQFIFDQRPKRIIHTIMGWWQGVAFRPNFIEMVFDGMISPYYGWLFPEAEDRVNIGITYEEDGRYSKARERFAAFLDRHYRERLRGAEQVGRFQGHPISYTYAIRDLYSPGRVIVGEAGRMTHPATGEGIYHAMQSGAYAADAIADILLRGVQEKAAMRRYHLRCIRRFTPSLLAGGAMRRILRTPLMDWVVGGTEQPLIQNAAAVVLRHV